MPVTKPEILKPVNNVVIRGNVMIFSWLIPTDSDNKKLVFKLELDTVSTFNSSNYKFCESRFKDKKNKIKWKFKDNNEFVEFPTGGVDLSHYNKEAQLFITNESEIYPDLNSTWFFRILVSNNLKNTAVYNQTVFGQVRFG